MGKNRQLFINLITTFIVLIINIFINFGLSRYIVDQIGEEAYGFISLANNFISYATIFTTALNSMASRFITIDIHNGRNESANKYFSSVLIANLIIVLALILPSVFIIGYLEHIINIPSDILIDVKLLFVFIFLNFFASLIGGVFSVATYCTNNLYLTSLKNMESAFLKVALILLAFFIFKPAVFYVGLATLIASIYVIFFNIRFTKRLLPNIKIKKRDFSFKKIKTLLSSGLWNSITSLGNVLADGLDLIISNLAINASTMGLVALAKVPGNALNTVLSGIGNVFQPQIIQYYAIDDMNSVVRETKKSMKISSIFGNIPFCYIVIFGLAFCTVWMPAVDTNLLYTICVITFINVYSGGVISPLYNIFTITNDVKKNALLNIGSGVVSTIIVLLLINTTDLGVYAIVGVSAIVGLLKGFILVPIFCSNSLKINKFAFFPIILRYMFTTGVILVIFFIIKQFLIVNNWFLLVVSIAVCGLVGLITNYFVLLNKDDREALIEIIKKKFRFRGEN